MSAAAAGRGAGRRQPLLHRSAFAAQVPPLEEKDTYTVGFAQTGSNNPWRLAETKSMQDEFEAQLGYTLVATDANEDTAKQIADVDSLIAQRRRHPHLPAARIAGPGADRS